MPTFCCGSTVAPLDLFNGIINAAVRMQCKTTVSSHDSFAAKLPGSAFRAEISRSKDAPVKLSRLRISARQHSDRSSQAQAKVGPIPIPFTNLHRYQCSATLPF